MGLNIENMGLYRWLMVGLLAYKFYRTDFKKDLEWLLNPNLIFHAPLKRIEIIFAY